MLSSNLIGTNILNNQSGGTTNSRGLNNFDAISLTKALSQDSRSYALAAISSFAEGLYGIKSKRYTWSIVKLYYSSFYSIRSILMNYGFSVFYYKNSPYLLESKAGETPKKQSGNTHSVVFKIFKQKFSSNIVLSQDIDLVDPLKWIEQQRNTASYKTAPFPDPIPPKIFSRASQNLRKSFITYLDDHNNLYSFDPDHAMIALPLVLLSNLDKDFRSQDRIIVNKHCKDIFVSADCYVSDLKTKFVSFQF